MSQHSSRNVKLGLLAMGAVCALAGVSVWLLTGTNCSRLSPAVPGEANALRELLARTRAELDELKDELGGFRRDLVADASSGGADSVSRAAWTGSLPAPSQAPGSSGEAQPSPPPSGELEEHMDASVEQALDDGHTPTDGVVTQEDDGAVSEEDALEQGPFGAFHLKVKSLSLSIGLTEAQQKGYYELSSSYWEALRELRQTANPGGEDSQEALAGMEQGLLDEYQVKVQELLNPEQLALYLEVPEWARNLHNQGRVPAAGESEDGVAAGADGSGPHAAKEWTGLTNVNYLRLGTAPWAGVQSAHRRPC